MLTNEMLSCRCHTASWTLMRPSVWLSHCQKDRMLSPWQAARVIRGSFRLEGSMETVRGVLDDLCPGIRQHQLKMRLALIMAATERHPSTGDRTCSKLYNTLMCHSVPLFILRCDRCSASQ